MTKRNVTILRENFLNVMRFLRNHKADVLIGVEFLLLIVLYAIFMVSDKVPLAGLVALGLLWMARWGVTGIAGTKATPMDVPVLGILALLTVSLYVSTNWSLSLPKVYGIILGVAIFYAVVNAIDSIRKLNLAIVGLILISVAVALLGLVGADWLSAKIFSLPQVYEFLPRLVREVPRSIAGGIHPNIVGGALTFFIPLLASLLLDSWEFKMIGFVTNGRLVGILRALSKSILLFSLAFASFTLLLTQSRGSLAGVAVALYALALWHDRRFLWAIPLAALSLFVMVQVWGEGNLAEFVLHIDTTGGGTFPGRMEIWQRAIYMIQDFSFTGVGIGTFSPVANVLYPFFLSANAQIPHAHNIFLTIAVDLGIPGLVFYAALLSGFFFSAWRFYQVAAKSLRALIVGLVCGMLAHQVFGIMDAFMLGSKLGVVMWVFMGLVAALYVRQDQLARELLSDMTGEGSDMRSNSGEHDRASSTEKIRRRVGSFFLPFAYWVLFSLLAIAFISEYPYLGLGIALIGGSILGFICTMSFESKNSFARVE